MKEKICAGLGMLGGMLAAALGGWDTGLRVLLCLMAADFCTGLVNAAVFHRSPKTGDGRLDSRRCFQGVCRKAEMLVFVGAAHAMDLLLESTFLRSAVLIGFCAGCMGLPLPAAWKNAVSLLNRKSETDPQEKE